ncbi:MAG TPA: sulfotransferase domain-containing protein [Sphingopyxis sp.]|uniref:sulfotransferase domain-containing protein n=1 Tax=Sphingopyxis sp. TaxID=1908224 RepID=UPI002E303988|nr:sulfotransferase domain-containing protein [Sphingopyxis sp.]HEX2814017.1 sulfotransferase domain-containing protein [Sphingopyxis sp.]
MTTASSGPQVPQGILWIASYPKSGNTWTRALLNNLLRILEGEDEGRAHDINKMSEFTVWDISAKRYERILGKPMTEVSLDEIAATRPQVQREIAEATDGLAIVKTHHALVLDRGVPAINFEITSGAIYIVRNPLDVAVSFAAHRGGSVDEAIAVMGATDLETATSDKSVYEVYGSWSQHVESWTRKPHRTIFVMRYEDMLADPRRVFAALADHLLLDPTPEQLDLAIERSSFDELRRQEEAEGYREKPKAAERFFRSGTAGQWRDILMPEQIERIVRRHHVQMARFGYLTQELKALLSAPPTAAMP